MSVIMPKSGKRFLSSLTADGINPLELNASLPSSVFKVASITGKSAITGMPSATHSSATLNNRSSETRFTPGIDETA